MKKKRYYQKGDLINSNAGYDEMSEQIEFREPTYKKPIDFKLLIYLFAIGVISFLLINFQSCN
jgi:hypothetical protein